jgi:hypothetical protein
MRKTTAYLLVILLMSLITLWGVSSADCLTNLKKQVWRGIHNSKIYSGASVKVNKESEIWGFEKEDATYSIEYAIIDPKGKTRNMLATGKCATQQDGRKTISVEYLPLDEKPPIHLRVE